MDDKTSYFQLGSLLGFKICNIGRCFIGWERLAWVQVWPAALCHMPSSRSAPAFLSFPHCVCQIKLEKLIICLKQAPFKQTSDWLLLIYKTKFKLQVGGAWYEHQKMLAHESYMESHNQVAEHLCRVWPRSIKRNAPRVVWKWPS